jgi:two-component system LytT family sensor kinase
VREGDKKAAVNMIVGLSDLLRLSLDKSGSQEVPLRQELEFVQKYLEIEQVRFQDRLTVAFDIEPAATKTQVPYLILQPLVENAIRHGISRRAGAAILEIKARLEGDRLCLEVRDNGPGLRGAGSGIGAGGLGLKIVRDRLRQHYGLRHSFELRDAEGGGASAIIRFPPPAAGGRNAAEADVAPKAPAVEEPPASEAIVCREDNQ